MSLRPGSILSLRYLSLPLICMAAPAVAEVVASDERGFVSRHEIDVSATPDAVWAALVRPELYWNGDHSWSGNAANFTLSPRAGGCFCERLTDEGGGGSVEHARVVMAQPGRRLVMRGALGPLQAEAVVGTLVVELADDKAGGTRMRWTYTVGGYGSYPMQSLSDPVDGVIGEQARRLAAHLDRGG